MAKWLEFLYVTHTGKTKKYLVMNKETRFIVGTIKWYRKFRKYSFFPSEDCVFEPTCLRDIANFIDELMTERKNERNKHEVPRS